MVTRISIETGFTPFKTPTIINFMCHRKNDAPAHEFLVIFTYASSHVYTYNYLVCVLGGGGGERG